MNALILILAFFYIIAAFFSRGQATPSVVARPQMKMDEFSMLNQSQQQNHTKLVETCSYMVSIQTSCGSPYYTTDQVDITFGDAYGNKVYVPRLDVIDDAFEPCSSAAFQIVGPCMSKICKLYLFRKGYNGWIPKKVTAYDYKYPPITFYYYSFNIPDDGSGYGYNLCKVL